MFHPTPGSNGHNCIKCAKANVRLRTPDDGQRSCPRGVIPIKLEFSASVGFIHKKSVKMHGHKIVKSIAILLFCESRKFDKHCNETQW
jgi:hypothetical protein